MLLSDEQIKELSDIIDAYHLAMAIQAVGVDVLSDLDKKLVSSFFSNDFISATFEPSVNAAFKFGAISVLFENAKKNKELNKLTILDFKKLISQGGGALPTTTAEKTALQFTANRVYSDIKGLGNKVKTELIKREGEVVQMVFTEIEADARKRLDFEKFISSKTNKAIVQKLTSKQLASELRAGSQDWSRDFNRIADYNLQEAYQIGRAESMQEMADGSESVMYYKDVFAGACKHCIRLYTTNGIGSEPKLFTMQELIANGSNIGLKSNEWKATLSPVHPFCRCELNSIDISNYKWNEEGGSFLPKEPKEPKEPKKYGIEFEFNGKKFYV